MQSCLVHVFWRESQQRSIVFVGVGEKVGQSYCPTIGTDGHVALVRLEGGHGNACVTVSHGTGCRGGGQC